MTGQKLKSPARRNYTLNLSSFVKTGWTQIKFNERVSFGHEQREKISVLLEIDIPFGSKQRGIGCFVDGCAESDGLLEVERIPH